MSVTIKRHNGLPPVLFFSFASVLVYFILSFSCCFCIVVRVPTWGSVGVFVDRSSDIFGFCGGGAVCLWFW